MKAAHPGRRRLYPPWWDHQRHTLVGLRCALERILCRHLAVGPDQRVVDIGCGDRPYEPLFWQRGCQYVGCDLNGDAEVRVEPGRPVDIPSASADGVVSFQVLEHVWNIDWYLGECHRILKPRGWMILSTHGTWLFHPHPTDYRRWTRDGLVNELHSRGFVVHHVEAVVGPLAWTTQFRLLGLRHFLRGIAIVGTILCAGIAMLMNLRMIVEDAITPSAIRETNACIYVVLAYKLSD